MRALRHTFSISPAPSLSFSVVFHPPECWWEFLNLFDVLQKRSTALCELWWDGGRGWGAALETFSNWSQIAKDSKSVSFSIRACNSSWFPSVKNPAITRKTLFVSDNWIPWKLASQLSQIASQPDGELLPIDKPELLLVKCCGYREKGGNLWMRFIPCRVNIMRRVPNTNFTLRFNEATFTFHKNVPSKFFLYHMTKEHKSRFLTIINKSESIDIIGLLSESFINKWKTFSLPSSRMTLWNGTCLAGVMCGNVRIWGLD